MSCLHYSKSPSSPEVKVFLRVATLSHLQDVVQAVENSHALGLEVRVVAIVIAHLDQVLLRG